MVVPSTAASPIKDAIDSHSGRFEFLKQTLTLASAGLAGIAALFTDPTRIPADSLSKGAILIAGITLAVAIYFSVMGLSVYANLLTTTAREAAGENPEPSASFYAKGLRNHARGVIVGLFLAFIAIGFFAGYRLFSTAAGTPETAIETASALISKETKQPPDLLYLTRLEADTDTFTVSYSVPALNSDATVRISKKDGSVIRLVQDKKSAAPGPRKP
jgi:hypothetical protein